MNDNVICVLANNMSFVEAMVANLPNDFTNYTLVTVNESRIGDKTREIREILDLFNVKDSLVIDSKDIVKQLKREVIDTTFVDEYTMGMNILMLWYVMKQFKGVERILLTDDDVIFFKGLATVFENDKNMFTSFRLSAGPVYELASDNRKQYMREWAELFGYTFSKEWYDEYIRCYKASGQRYIVRSQFDLDFYEESLKKFFMCEKFLERWRKRRTHTSWFFDEVFECMVFPYFNNGMNKYTNVIVSKPEKIDESSYARMSNRPIMHNATKSHKLRLLQNMRDRHIIW